MKKKLFFVLGLLMAVTMQAQTYWNGTSDKTFSGSGTQTDPYLISTPEQLAGLAELCNDRDNPNDFDGKYIKLTADIYLTDFNNPDTASWPQWEPIGHYVRKGFENGFSYSRYFRGHFDGDGHTIYNMYYKGDVDWGGDINLDPNDWENNNMEDLENLTWDSWYRGLFCFLEGTAENVTVADARLAGIYVAPFAHQVGENAVVRNCHVQNPYMYATQGSNYGFVQDNYGLIENSSVQVNLIGRYNSYGFAGTNHESGIIRDCHANVSSDSYFCAPVAYINQGLIERTHTTVDITSDHAMMASGFVYNNQNEGVIRECSSSGTVRGLGNAPRTVQWSGQIAGFCIINTGLIESSWTTCDMVRIDGEYSYDMAGFVLANGYNGSGVQYDGIPGNAINCFTAGTLTFSSEDITSGLHPFLQQYNGTSGTPSTPYYSPSRQFNCFWTKEGTPQVTNLSHSWAGDEVTLAQLQSQAFVDTLNMVARFMGTSQWEYRPGQLPRPTGVYIHDKTVFFAQGNGTADDPYLVGTKAELEHLAWLVNRGYDFRNEYIKQTADIELNAPESEWSEVAPTKWTTIGKTRNSPYFSVAYPLYFDGSYDGDFHEVKNLYINDPSGSQGLFGNVGSSHGGGGEYGMPQEQYYIRPAVIRNLGVTGVYIRATKAGAVVGGLGTKANLIQCWSSGKIYAASAYSQLAGLSGSIYMHSCILNSKTSVALYPISSTGSGELRSFSGEVGGSQIDTIVNALYTGAYQSSQQRESLYAFSASAHGGMYKNVYRDSTLSPQNAGWNGTYLYSTQQMQSKELVNILNTTVMEWNDIHGAGEQLDYWKWRENDYPHISRDTVGLFYKVTFETNEGSSILPMYVVPGSQITAPMRPTKSGYLFHAWYRDEALTDFFDFKRDSVTSNMTLYAKWMVDARGDYDLTPFQNEFATTYHISTAAQLRGLAVAQMGIYDWTNYNIATNEGTKTTVTAPMDFTGKTIVLDNDIFLNDTIDWKLWGNHCYAVPWTPIGQNIPQSGMDISFKGTFDGQGHVVYGLYCEMGTTVAGYTDRYDSQFGLFACLNGGTVRNVGVEASVIDLRKHDDAPLPYEAAGSATTQKGISIYGNRAGMLIGKLQRGTVEQCFAKGRIIPHEKDPMYAADISDSYLGGLISSVEGTMGDRTSGSVSNCYAQVDIIREQYNDVKGYAIIGSGVSKTDHYCEVTFANCYGAGICSQGNNIATTYYNKDLVVKPASNTSAKSTFSMRTMSNYAGWDFETVWARNDDYNDGYPVLRIFHPGIENSPDPVTVTGIEMEETVLNVIAGEQVQLHANVLPIDAQEKGIYWTITNTYTDVAEVDESGLVTTHFLQSRAGYTTTSYITATTVDGNFQKRCTLNVYHPSISVVAQKYFRRIDTPDWIYIASTSMNYVGWQTLMAITINPDSLHQAITFENSNPEVAQFEIISQDTTYNGKRCALGTLTCYTKGSTTLTIKHPNGYTCSRTFSVYQYDLKGISIHAPSTTMNVGETMQLSANTTPIYASTQPEGYMWSSSDESVLYVDYTGKLIAKKAGTATITLNSSNPSYTATILITVAAINPTSISIIPDRITIGIGETYQLTTSILPENATRDITWNMYNEWDTYTASVSKDGLVTGHAEGNVTVVATTINGLKAYCSVDVITKVTGVTLDNSSLEMQTGSTKYLTATVQPTNADNKEIVWSTTNENIAKVNASGSTRCRITANNAGEAMVIVTTKEGNFSDTCLIIVSKPIVYYTVAFKDWNGTTLKTEQVEQGKSATAPADPVREGYTFIGWDKDFSNVQSDLTVTAQYEKNVVYYTVTFLDWDGTTLKTEQVEQGKSATAPADPIREGYTFIGWNKDFSNVQSNLTVTAQYEQIVTPPTPESITVRLDPQSCSSWSNVYLYAWDQTPIAGSWPGTKVSKDADGWWSYTFDNKITNVNIIWNNGSGAQTVDITNVTASTCYKLNTQSGNKIQATVVDCREEVTPVYFTVTFQDWNGTVLKTEQVEQGKSATAPADPVREGYTFIGWDKSFSNVQSDLTVTAQYEKNVVYYTVTFLDWDGTTLKTEQVEQGKSATAPAAPVREGYTFIGWDKDFSNVQSDLTVTAQYEKNVPEPIYYTVTFQDWDGTVLKTEQVEQGKSATAPATPVREGYTFTGWDKDFSNVQSDLTVTALYEQNAQNDAITVRLNPSSAPTWSNVYLYSWYDGGAVQPCGAWPGLQVSKDSNGWWSYTFDTNVKSVNIIWNNGIGEQTIDITDVTQSTCYDLDTDVYPYGAFVIDCSKNLTALEDVQSNSTPKAHKVIKNNTLYIILPDGSSYSATGQKL